jgi:hypothetical protein
MDMLWQERLHKKQRKQVGASRVANQMFEILDKGNERRTDKQKICSKKRQGLTEPQGGWHVPAS